ncbi:MAG: carboxypeptidase regulatory-like domain-containing protein [Blastocatellia bacterium]
MKLGLLSLLISLSFHLAQAQTPPRDARPRTASIAGRVTIGGKPAANAKVAVEESQERRVEGASSFPVSSGRLAQGSEHDALTDGDGRYRVANLPEGRFDVRVVLNAYVAEGKAEGNGLTRTVAVEEGESAGNIDFSLVRGGVITGRVTDDRGHPLIGRGVQLRRLDEKGEARPDVAYLSARMFSIDDRGIYRLYGLRAGRYLVGAGGEEGGGFFGAAGKNYPLTWHPNAANEKQAKIIEVKAGGEVEGIDITIGGAKKTFEAIGRVIDDATGQPIPGVNLVSIKTDDQAGGFSGMSGMATADAQGAFRLSGLAPGRYQLMMVDYGSMLPGGKSSGFYSEGATFEVLGGDVSGVEVRAKRGATISGVAVLDGASDPALKSKLGQTMISAQPLQAHEPGPNPDVFSGGIAMPSMIKGDGSFQISGLRQGKVLLTITSITGQGPALIRVERNGADVTEGFEVKAGETITGVRAILGVGTGVIRGQVVAAGGELPAGLRLMVAANREKHSVRMAEVDGKGRFTFEALLPGEYELRVMAMTPNPGANPGMDLLEPAAQRVTVANGAEAQMTLTVELKKKNQKEQR